MPEKTIMADISHWNIISVIIGFFVASVSVNFAIIKISMGIFAKNMQNYQNEINKKIESVFENFGNDFSRLGSKIMIMDDGQREQENNLVKHETEINNIIKTCDERHNK